MAACQMHARRLRQEIMNEEFPPLTIRVNPRARRYTFRVVDGQLVATVPPGYRPADLQRAVEELRPRLREMLDRDQQRRQRQFIDADFRIQAPDFQFYCKETSVHRMRLLECQGCLVCYYPPGQDFTNPRIQEWLWKQIRESLRRHAQVLFPPRLRQMAQQRGLQYQSLTIRDTHTRWGSCSSRGSINLSLYLMLVPRHLQDYVMQHELTHLVHMDHSPRFWQLLDQYTQGRSRELRQELRAYPVAVVRL